jgi:hypothetical protein
MSGLITNRLEREAQEVFARRFLVIENRTRAFGIHRAFGNFDARTAGLAHVIVDEVQDPYTYAINWGLSSDYDGA